ncbi:hypothetical protein C8R45DRAFT_1212891 [Mycena sanguinolenta]|nr:hypothetical protein C8R45DRAFT_1212891 [Mycena sanguinolenta]
MSSDELLGNISTVLKSLTWRKPEPAAHVSPTLVTIPSDILHLILVLLADSSSLSVDLADIFVNKRYLGYFAKCIIGKFKPETIWPFFRTGHIRDRSIQHPANIALLPTLYEALPAMLSLIKVTLRLEGPLPSKLLDTLSLIPRLMSLDIIKRGFRSVVRADNIYRAQKLRNILALLKTPSPRLTALQISGDLLCLLSKNWNRDDLLPPFTLGTPSGGLLTRNSPLLRSVTLSNLQPANPIFAQLLPALPSLHVRAMFDEYIPDGEALPWSFGKLLSHSTALVALENISHLNDLADLSLPFDDFPKLTIIRCVASIFPRLRYLTLEHASYSDSRSAGLPSDVRNPALLEALQSFPFLTRLRI